MVLSTHRNKLRMALSHSQRSWQRETETTQFQACSCKYNIFLAAVSPCSIKNVFRVWRNDSVTKREREIAALLENLNSVTVTHSRQLTTSHLKLQLREI